MNEKVEEEEYVKVPDRSGIWRPEAIGDELLGKYVSKESAPFRGRPNYKYCLESDHPVNVDGYVKFYGTEGLNNGMSEVRKGDNIKIVFQGERPTDDPKKKAFKKFGVYILLKKSDPRYEKFKGENSRSENQTLAKTEAPEARNMIENYVEIYKSNNYDVEPAAEDIIGMAKTDPDLDSNDLSRVKIQLAEMVKSGKIKSGST